MTLLPLLIAFSSGLYDKQQVEYEMPLPEPAITAPATAKADALAVTLFRDVVAENKGNVVFSPASAESMLRLLQQAAAGKTRAELDALPMGERGVATALQPKQACALYADQSLNLRNTPAPVQRVDFRRKPAAAVEDINAWCRKQTEGRIPSILSPTDVSPMTGLVALDALYLKERWLRPFDTYHTKEAPFHKADGSTVQVPMMYQKESFRAAAGKDWVAVALLYRTEGREGTPGAFIGILPKGDARAFAAALTPQKYAAIVHALATAKRRETQLYLPKFKVTTGTVSLKNVLIKAGAGTMFTDAAQFTFATEPLKVDKVMQRCFVEVNEDGTEAAAVSVVDMQKSAVAPTPPPVIRFDKPFIWAIGDLTSAAAPWFMGLVEDVQSTRLR